jgi:HlyD family secretion protein
MVVRSTTVLESSRSRTTHAVQGFVSLRVGAVLSLVGLVALSAMIPAPWGSSDKVASQEGAPVRRGPLNIQVTTSGNLLAAESARLTSGVEGKTTILALTPEGTQVKTGDIVCELDATALVEKRIQQSITVGNAEAALVKGTQARAIQESQNQSDIDKAIRMLEFAAQDLQMFLEGEREVELEKAQQAIDLAREESQRAQSTLTWSEQLNGKGFLTSTELEADRISEHRSTIMLQQATRERELLERYKLPRREKELRALMAEAELEKSRVELQAQARLVDFESEVRSCKAELELEQEKLARLEKQIDKAKLRAPRDGYVVYAIKDDDDPPVGEGVEVREREEILFIPSSEGMLAEVKLHESVLKQVEVGQHCTIKVDALPGAALEGRVAMVAMLPDQNSRWSNPGLRVYRCQIAITTQHQGMRPGMSCAVTISIENLADALYVPLQAVFRDGSRTVAFLVDDRSRPREVRVGRYSDLWVQILEGLSEGDTVLLHPPASWSGSLETAVEGETQESS